MSGQNSAQLLSQKIKAHQAQVVVIGLGYVGLPFAVEKAKVGFPVIGIEQNPERAAQVNRGENYIADVKDNELKALVSSGHLQAVETYACIARHKVIAICLPPPLT